jgi:hypothetical protein
MVFAELSHYRHVLNLTKCPQHYGQLIIPGKGYAAATEDAVKAMRTAGVPLVVEGDPNFTPLFKRCTGLGIIA